MSSQGPWLTDPKVQLHGPMAREFTYATDGQTTRIKQKPIFGGEIEPTPSWPARPKNQSPWIIQQSTSLGHDQSLVTDGLTAWPKQRPRFASEPLQQGNPRRTTTTTTTTTSTTTTTTSTTTTSTTTTSTTTTSTTTTSTTTTSTTTPPPTTTMPPPPPTTPPP